MSLLDSNIKNNLFRKAGAIGANVLSGKVIEELKENLLDKAGENNLISARGFLGSQAASIIRRLLFTSPGVTGEFDPVWKLTQFQASDTNGNYGSVDKTVIDDFGGSGAPKYKFMWTVSIGYRQTLRDLLSGNPPTPTPAEDDQEVDNTQTIETVTVVAKRLTPASGSENLREVSFALKSATRPNPIINFQDVNFYNYRTKIATKVEYGTVTLTFYDDIRNTAHDIYEAYLKTISPIARVDGSPAWVDYFDKIAANPENNPPNNSSLGALPEDEELGLIRTITITHHLPVDYSSVQTQPNATGLAKGTILNSPVVRYIFINPKVQSFVLDDLDMTVNDTTTVSLTFVYDSVYIEKDSIEYDATPNVDEVVEQINQGGILETIANTVNQQVNTLNNNTLLTKVKNFINF